MFFYACARARGGTALSNRVLLGAVEGSMQASALSIVSASRVRHTCQTIKEKSCKVKRPRLQQHDLKVLARERPQGSCFASEGCLAGRLRVLRCGAAKQRGGQDGKARAPSHCATDR